MDDLRFDDLTRRLTAASSRRAGLKAALGGLLGLGLAGGEIQAGARKPRKKRRSTLRCSTDDPCPPGMWCFRIDGDPVGQCMCLSNGQPSCGTVCCPEGQRCERGACICTLNGRPPCPGGCCQPGETCRDGRCTCGASGGWDRACFEPYVCQDNRCCKTLGLSCTAVPGLYECCEGLSCQGSRCCKGYWKACTNDAECCDSLICTSQGVCGGG